MSAESVITSRHNPVCRHIELLSKDRAYRREKGEMLCEGAKLYAEALERKLEIALTVVAESFSCGGTQDAVLLSDSLFKRVSTLETPQGVLFVCKTPRRTPESIVRAGGRVVVLDRLQEPGNVGSIIRTACAFGLDGVLLTEDCADPESPKAVRASSGAVLSVPYACSDRVEILEAVRKAELRLVCADIGQGGLRPGELSSCALVLGREGGGVDAFWRENRDATVEIPMTADCQSLGVAAAAAVLIWHMREAGL